ncbi:mitochondrial proton/calcium exchanger protein-like isoform X2 [Acanthaster planci]|uniref:Mitochondrial proton/calcium exchanger protein n=1 Tax=Acanthaster planci TaxID=133434 RepID=A0A8B7YYI5_ACAPL|nr:mitochondrial proton/calcium exchanger protein-like isoform X2 [Acanthaster planci]
MSRFCQFIPTRYGCPKFVDNCLSVSRLKAGSGPWIRAVSALPNILNHEQYRVYHCAAPINPELVPLRRPILSSQISMCCLYEYQQPNRTVPLGRPVLRYSTTVLYSNGRTRLPHERGFHISRPAWKELDETDTKIEQAVKVLKEKRKEKEIAEMVKTMMPSPEQAADPSTSQEVALPKKPLMTKIMDEIKHYWNGFRLLGVDLKISARLLWRVLNGHALTRREYKQFTRTVSDLFRMVPFSVFIIIPFMEFLLPVALWLFPNMLPSTFQSRSDKEKKLKQELKVKLEMAKFLQDTIEDTALQSKKPKATERARQFAHFIEKIRTSGEQASNEEIIKFSKLFEDELTLDNLNRQQLTALCRLLRLQPVGTNNFLRFQLRMQLRSLMADDKMIQKEGVDSLTVSELQAACQARGMRALGVPVERLKSQLQQWLDLHINEQIPTSLLLLSRALYLPETLSTPDQLKATIASLPEATAEEAKVKLAELEGEKVDNTDRLNIIRKEEEEIKKEMMERAEQQELEKKKVAEAMAAEELVDDAKVQAQHVIMVLREPQRADEELMTKEDLQDLGEVIKEIAEEKESMLSEKGELQELRQDVEEYKEDLADLKKEVEVDQEDVPKLVEAKSSARLGKRVNRMVARLENIVAELEVEKAALVKEKKELKADWELRMKEELEPDAEMSQKMESQLDLKKKSILRVEELVNAMQKFGKVSDEMKLKRIVEVLDEDKDGVINIQDAMKVIEVIAKEDIALSTKQVGEIMDLICKEEILAELEEAVEREEQAATETASEKNA